MGKIISVSRRTDIPALYSDWFFTRVKEGYCQTKNPYSGKLSDVSLKPEDVTAFVFWTKNPKPMISRLDELKDYCYYFQVTLNSYGKDLEPNVPSKGTELIATMKELAAKIGKERVVWRYDPILISEKYTVEYHKKYFAELAERLKGCFRHCVISFIDIYDSNKNLDIRVPTEDEKKELITYMLDVAKSYGFDIYSCAEKGLMELGVKPSHCIDAGLISELTGQNIDAKKDRNQRAECGCCASTDIGVYNTCTHCCKYCYANHKNIHKATQINPYLD